MKIESPAFTDNEVDQFFAEYREHERGLLVERLEAIGDRLARFSAQLGSQAAGNQDGPGMARSIGQYTVEWSARDVLMHLATMTRFFGAMAYRVGTGKISEFDLLAAVQERDPASERLAELPTTELVGMIQAARERTLDWLRSATLEQLARTADVGGGRSLSAEAIVRYPYCAHLEQHLQQLEAAVAGR